MPIPVRYPDGMYESDPMPIVDGTTAIDETPPSLPSYCPAWLRGYPSMPILSGIRTECMSLPRAYRRWHDRD